MSPYIMNQFIETNETMRHEELYMKSRESVTKDLWKTSINDLQSNILWKAINECEEKNSFHTSETQKCST